MPRDGISLEAEDTVRKHWAKKIRFVSREEGRALQDALVRALSQQEFQKKLHTAWNAARGSKAKQTKARQEVCMEVQGPILSRFGFEPSFTGLMECYMSFGPELKTDPEIAMLNHHLNWLVDPALQTEKALEAKGHVSVWHQGTSMDFLVDLADDVQALKEKIAERVGIPDVAQQLFLGGKTFHPGELLSTFVPSGGSVDLVLEHAGAGAAEQLIKLKEDELAKTPLQHLSEIPRELFAERAFVLAAVGICGRFLRHAEASLQADVEVVLLAVQSDGLSLEYASPGVRANGEVVCAALRQNGFAIEFAAPELRASRDLALFAVNEQGWALPELSSELQMDIEVVATAVSQNWEVLEIVDAALQAEATVVLAAVRQDGRALQFAAPHLRADREVVLAAVRTTGEALRFADFSLQEDRELALEAVLQHWEVIQQLKPGVQDLEVASAAVKQDIRALHFIEPGLKAKVASTLGVKAPTGGTAAPPPLEVTVKETALAKLRKHFVTLGLDERVSPEAVRRRYRQLALEHHPDKHPEDVEAAKRRFQLINHAYKAIKDQLGHAG